jgi:hypothetical protein
MKSKSAAEINDRDGEHDIGGAQLKRKRSYIEEHE